MCSFNSFSNNYVFTTMHRYQVLLLERHNLDRRRVEDAYYQFAVLRVCSWYPSNFQMKDLALHNSTSGTMQQMVTNFHGIFMEKYSSK